MSIYKRTYRIPSTRLINWDYGSNGLYFITICTKDRVHYFGNIVETQNILSLRKSQIGTVAYENWLEIPKHFPFVELDEFTIMPNHLHGILFFNKPGYDDWHLNRFGPQRKNLASVIRGYKSSVKKNAVINKIEFSWQPRYYDRVIRNENELKNIRKYINNNPVKWLEDANNFENLYV